MSAVAINVILFKIFWWSIVVAASIYMGKSDWLIFPALFYLALHFKFVVKVHKKKELIYLILASAVGYLGDSFFHKYYILNFNESFYSLAPLWLLAIWFVFLSTIGHSLIGLKERPIASFLFGFLLAPLSYQAGESLGLLYYTDLESYLIYSLYWGVMMCVYVCSYKVCVLGEKCQ